MKKTLLAATVFAAFAGSAFAQSNVTIYGVVDAGFQRMDNGVDHVTRLTSGMQSGSRIGFRGTEDLGGGLSAIFQLENGFNVDTGGLGQDNTLFNRQAFVGLQHSAVGAVKFGRQYIPIRAALESTDPFGIGMAGAASNLFNVYGERADNTVNFTSANFGGFVAQLSYSFGETSGSDSVGRSIGASGAYGNGPIKAVLAYHRRDNRNAAATAGPGVADSIYLGGVYDFGVARLHAGYERNDGESITGADAVDNDAYMLGVSAPFGASTVMASYLHRNNDFADNADSKQLSLGYTYALSKRTNFYTSYSKIKNDANGLVAFGSSGFGSTTTGAGGVAVGRDPSRFDIGVRHQF